MGKKKGGAGMGSSEGFKGFGVGLRHEERLNSSEMYEENGGFGGGSGNNNNNNNNNNKKKKIDNT